MRCCFQVLYKTPVSITEHPKINEWLTLVEREMRVTLAKLLAESVTEVGAFNKGTGIDLSTYINWIDRYQVTRPPRLTQRLYSMRLHECLTSLSTASRPSWWFCPRRSTGLRTWRML